MSRWAVVTPDARTKWEGQPPEPVEGCAKCVWQLRDL